MLSGPTPADAAASSPGFFGVSCDNFCILLIQFAQIAAAIIDAFHQIQRSFATLCTDLWEAADNCDFCRAEILPAPSFCLHAAKHRAHLPQKPDNFIDIFKKFQNISFLCDVLPGMLAPDKLDFLEQPNALDGI